MGSGAAGIVAENGVDLLEITAINCPKADLNHKGCYYLHTDKYDPRGLPMKT